MAGKVHVFKRAVFKLAVYIDNNSGSSNSAFNKILSTWLPLCSTRQKAI